MRASIIVSAFAIFFVSIATAVVAWNQQQISEREDTNALSSANEHLECEPLPKVAGIAPRAVRLSSANEHLASEPSLSSPQSPPECPPATKSEEPSKQPPTDAMLREIESIRRQLGIRLFPANPLGAEEQPAGQDFRNALKSVVSKESGVDAPASTPRLPYDGSQHAPLSSLDPSPIQDSSLNAKVMSAMQESIFALEQRAALAEEQRQYDVSDRSRRLAHRLRKEIRTLQEDISPSGLD